MPAADTRRIELHLHKPWYALYAGVRPTLVLGGRGQPTQWGPGTWQVPATAPTEIGIFLFNRMWRFGQAQLTLDPAHEHLIYRAPMLPFLPGSLRPARTR